MSQKGFRCKVCTGCGLCPGICRDNDNSIKILTDSSLPGQVTGSFASPRARLAVADIGTTTIALQLLDRDGRASKSVVQVNPQIKYGADVISRIEQAKAPQKAEEMRRMVLEVLEKALISFLQALSADDELYLVIAGNTTMVYLLMGYDPKSLGQAPFRADHLEPMGVSLLDGGVKGFVFPGLSAFVGGDIVAGIKACGMEKQQDVTLLIDLGTNGEMVLGNCEKMVATATAAGPAFEGGVNKGVFGSDMLHFIHALRKEQLTDENGLLTEDCFENGVRVGNVLVTQEAIRSIQCAKAAIAAGIQILTSKYGVKYQDISRVVLAGGFGYFLRPEDAVGIGLLPKALLEKTISGGNTSLLGAKIWGMRLLQQWENPSEDEWKALFESKCPLEALNLAEEKDFAEKYMEAMSLKSF